MVQDRSLSQQTETPTVHEPTERRLVQTESAQDIVPSGWSLIFDALTMHLVLNGELSECRAR